MTANRNRCRLIFAIVVLLFSLLHSSLSLSHRCMHDHDEHKSRISSDLAVVSNTLSTNDASTSASSNWSYLRMTVDKTRVNNAFLMPDAKNRINGILDYAAYVWGSILSVRQLTTPLSLGSGSGLITCLDATLIPVSSTYPLTDIVVLATAFKFGSGNEQTLARAGACILEDHCRKHSNQHRRIPGRNSD